MRLRNVKGKEEIIDNSKYIIKNPKEYLGKYNSIFNNDNDIYIEIGMGKGKFIIENAIRFPNINFIGIEKFDSVIVRALEKLDKFDLKNIKLIRMDALEIDEVFNHEISRIYLNFSDPWPKKRHAKRRLTSEIFLEKYSHICKDRVEIHLKTDNKGLFAYSLESLNNNGYTFNNVTLDLEDSEDNIKTEYEEKFRGKNVYINRLEATKNINLIDNDKNKI